MINNASQFPDARSRWRAVTLRDPAADCAFVYAVKTTRIYCRPVCKARLARQSNVDSFALARDAERAGYRACKRCRPELKRYMPDNRAAVKIFQSVSDALANSAPLPPIKALSQQTGVSRWHLHRQFKRMYGVTPAVFSASFSGASSPASSSSGVDLTMARTDFELFPEQPGQGVPVEYAGDFDAGLGQAATDPGRFSSPPRERILYAIRDTLHGPLLVAFRGSGLFALALGESVQSSQSPDRQEWIELDAGRHPELSRKVDAISAAVELPVDDSPS